MTSSPPVPSIHETAAFLIVPRHVLLPRPGAATWLSTTTTIPPSRVRTSSTSRVRASSSTRLRTTTTSGISSAKWISVHYIYLFFHKHWLISRQTTRLFRLSTSSGRTLTTARVWRVWPATTAAATKTLWWRISAGIWSLYISKACIGLKAVSDTTTSGLGLWAACIGRTTVRRATR